MAGAEDRKVDQTSTWAIATVVAVIVVISLLLEHVLHKFTHWLTKKRKVAMVEVLEKVKAELMIMGFISLLLTILGDYVAKICVTSDLADTMLPCKAKSPVYDKEDPGKGRRLLWDELSADATSRRFLAGGYSSHCPEGKESFVSEYGIHQLHIFIFFLAVWHVLTCAFTMTLGRLKIRGWKDWERETESKDYEFSNDPTRFRFTRENSFVRQHISFWTRNTILFYITSFFRQFIRSVRKADYQTVRHGFIVTHLSPRMKFNFQKYIKRSLVDDFKVVVGISPTLWASAMIVLLLNVKGWKIMFWVSILPLIILLAVGTKLQAIITRMAIEIQEKHMVIQGIPVVQLNDRHFWFKSPKFVLFLIHFTLFQNAFQIIYFLWIWYTFGLHSCFHENLNFVVARVCVGVAVQFLCSYVTLPLYALVSQSGTHMKRSIFGDHTSQALKKWHQKAKDKHAHGMSSTTPNETPDASPVHQTYRCKTLGHSKASPTNKVTKRHHSDNNLSNVDDDMLFSNPTHHNLNDLETGGRVIELQPQVQRQQQQQRDEEIGDFSFTNGIIPQGGRSLM